MVSCIDRTKKTISRLGKENYCFQPILEVISYFLSCQSLFSHFEHKKSTHFTNFCHIISILLENVANFTHFGQGKNSQNCFLYTCVLFSPFQSKKKTKMLFFNPFRTIPQNQIQKKQNVNIIQMGLISFQSSFFQWRHNITNFRVFHLKILILQHFQSYF